MPQKWARPWFATTFVLVVVELVITCSTAADNTGGHFHSAAARVFNVFWYFTIQSNVIVGVTCLLLAVNPRRTSTVFVPRGGVETAVNVGAKPFHEIIVELKD